MNWFLMLLGIGVAGFAGYVLEPSLRERLTGEAPSSGKTLVVNIDELTPEQLPDKVMLNVPVELTSPDGDITLPIGSLVKPLSIDGHSLLVGMNTLKGKVAVEDTDLLKRLAANPPKPVVKAPEPPAVLVTPPVPVPVPTPEPTPPPVPEPVPTPVPAPEPEVVTRGESQPEPVTPAPAPEPTAPATLGDADIVKIMQESYRSGLIKEFVVDKAVAWKATGEEKVDGESYLTGLVDYSAETIFGVKNVQAKALIKGGKVVKWISPKSGMEIK